MHARWRSVVSCWLERRMPGSYGVLQVSIAPTIPRPRARCSTIRVAAIGTRMYWMCWKYRVRFCPLSSHPALFLALCGLTFSAGPYLSLHRLWISKRHCSVRPATRSEEHTSELQSHSDLVCRLLLEIKKNMP